MTALPLILVGAIVGTGAILWVHHTLTHSKTPETPEPNANEQSDDEECCGMHITCEKDSLLAAVSEKIEYYDDEELDRFAGRDADSYSDEETDEFRDVMLTMRPDEIAGWVRSIQLRGIALPRDVRDELILIVSEERTRRTSPTEHA